MKKCFKWINENKELSGLLLVVALLIFVPAVVYGLSVPALIPNGGNDWSGFWGGYLGGIIGGGITLYVLFKTLDDGKRVQKREEKLVYCDRIVEDIAEFNREVSLLLIKIIKFHNDMTSGNGVNIQEFLGDVYAVEKSEFILTVKLCSNEVDKEYERIEEIKNIVERIMDLIKSVTNPVINGTISEMNQNQFDEVSEKVKAEKEKLLEEAIHFLTVNKR